METELLKSQGTIHISYSVNCPHCDEYLDDYYEREWFVKTMGGDFPIDDGCNDEFEAECPKCKQPFIIDKFIY